MKKVNQSIFEKEYPITDNLDLAKKYECSEGVIRILAAAFHLKKGQSEWSEQHEAYLLKNYRKKTMDELMEHLKRSRWGIINKYRELSGKTKKKVISKVKE